jgi:hypothetical protein
MRAYGPKPDAGERLLAERQALAQSRAQPQSRAQAQASVVGRSGSQPDDKAQKD